MTLMQAHLEADQPFYFGSERELFGLYQPAQGLPDKAILLCPPLGQDQIRCHRLYRQLAHALAAKGMAVLRFDYYGCGDSAGTSDQVQWDRCIADSRAAADALRLRSGCDHVVAVGARLGGSIALVAAREARFAEVIAWDPVLDGREHVARLDALQAQICQDPGRFSVARKHTGMADQWSGFAVSPALRRQLETLQVAAAGVPTLVLDSLAVTTTRRWSELDVDSSRIRTIEPETSWYDLGRLELAILSRAVIDTVVQHLRETP